jgi:hypothetical protein
MALKHTESFEISQSNTGKYPTNYGGFNPTPGRTGNAGYLNGGDLFSKDLDAGIFTKFYGFAFKMTDVKGSDTQIFSVGETLVQTSFALVPVHVSIYVTPGRLLKVTRGLNVATLATGTTPLTPDSFYYIELKVKCHSTLGEIELHLDTLTEIAPLTGQNTRNAGAGVIPAFQLHWPAGTWQFDDLYVCDDQGPINNTFRGLCAVQTRDAVTDVSSGGGGGMKDWTPSAGTDHGALVDEVTPNGDTDFVASNTPGHIDTFKMQPITVPGTAVAGVLVYHQARKTDVGVRTMNSACRIGGTNYVSPSPDQALVTSYTIPVPSVFDVDPSTGSAWASQAAVNAAEFGPKLVA